MESGEVAVKELAEYVFERDRDEFSLGDTLDIKTGLILASLTFLALQSGGLIADLRSASQTIIQIVAILALLIGGALSVLELWPRSYEREAMPDSYDQWISEMEKFHQQHPDPGPEISVELHQARLIAAKQRIRVNGGINVKKSTFMFSAFYCVVTAFAANIITLLMRLF